MRGDGCGGRSCAALWDYGVGPSRDSGEGDQIFRRDDGRALYVRDPDGNEIELLEEDAAQGRAALSRRCPVSRWRRVMRRCCSAAG